MKKLIAMLLLVSTLMLSSCEYFPFLNKGGEEQSPSIDSTQNLDGFTGMIIPERDMPEGYTGGWGFAHEDCFWVETPEECIAAIESLKSHGSTFKHSVIFTYENEVIDMKYCFGFSRTKPGDAIKYGEDPFDRYYTDVWVASIAFYADVTIEEIVYSDITEWDYEAFWAGELNWSSEIERAFTTTEKEFLESLEYRKYRDRENSYGCYANGKHVFDMVNISEEYVEPMFNSIRIIDYNASGF